MRIQHNIMAMNAYRNYSNNTSALAKNLEKLSSGYKINRAGDDAAGLAISEKMRAQITGLKTAQKNAKDGISLIQTAEGALTEVHDMLNRALELSEQSANGTYDNDLDRKQMQKELDQLRSEIDRIADSTNFNGIKLLDGSLDQKLSNAMEGIEGLVDNTDGVIVNAPVNGAGIKDTYEIGFGKDALFGAGDTISFDIRTKQGDGSSLKETITLSYNTTSTEAGADFKGGTLEEQMNSLAKSLNANTKINGNYEASVLQDADGNAIGVKLTGKAEKVSDVQIDVGTVRATDKQVTLNTSTPTIGDAGTQIKHAAQNMGWNNLFNGTSAADMENGDTIKFAFKVDGVDHTVTLEAGKDFELEGDTAKTTKSVVDALKAASFDNKPGTAIKESEFKVDDYFSFAENKNGVGATSEGSIQVTSKASNLLNEIGDITITDVSNGNATKTITGQNGVEAFTETYEYTAGAAAGNADLDTTGSNVALDASINLTDDSTTLTDVQIANLKAKGAVTIDDSLSVKFVDKDTATGKLDEVLVDKTVTTGKKLLDAIQASLNAQSKAKATTAAKDNSGGSNVDTYEYTLVGTAAGEINRGVGQSQRSKIAYTKGNALVAAKNEVSKVDVSNEFSVGDGFTLRGKLSDGRDFSVSLTAVADDATPGANEFKVGDGHGTNANPGSISNIKSALESGASKVVITNSDGSTEEVGADEIFGTGKEFTVSIDVDATSDPNHLGFSLTSTRAGATGKGVAAKLNSAERKVADPITATARQTATGKVPSKAENVFTFDAEKVEQGTSLSINGKIYEFVTDAQFITKEGNVAVVVDKLGKRDDTGALASDAATGDDIANALKSVLEDTAGSGTMTVDGKVYDLTADAGTNALKITSQASGTDAVALADVAVSSTKRDAAIVKFGTTKAADSTKTNPKFELNVKVGDTVTINGKTYEFTDGEHRTKEEGNVGVSLKDVNTAQEAAHALADAVNTSDGGKVIATVNEKDGSVVLTSKFNADAEEGVDPYKAPDVTLPVNSNGLTLQIGDTADSFNKLSVSIKDMHADSLGIGDISILDQKDADIAATALKEAINKVSDMRGTLGATQNRLDHTINNLSVMQENIQDAESSIRDVDVAQEMMEYTKNNILVQSAQAMLAQANQVPQGVLQLLQ